MRERVVVVSYSSLTAINRKVYVELSKTCDVVLLIPEASMVNNMLKPADPQAADDPVTVRLPLRGNNPRLHYLKGMWKAFRTYKPQCIYVENDPMSLFCVWACFYKLFAGAKIFCQTNENFSLSFKRLWSNESIRSKILLLVKRIVCFFVRPFVDIVYTINYEGKDVFEQLKFKNVKWIPLGYDPACFYVNGDERNKARDQLKLNSFVIGYFGRIVPEKGLMLLLQALYELQEFSWQLLIDDFSLYTTDYISEIKKFIAEKELTKKIFFFHAVHDEMVKYMNACDLTVVPSVSTSNFKEQYGRVVQEAIACGCLTIVSDSGFLPHFFNEPFFIFKENDKEAVKNKIKEVIALSEEDRKTLQQRSMKYIQQNFSIEAQAILISNSIRELKN